MGSENANNGDGVSASFWTEDGSIQMWFFLLLLALRVLLLHNPLPYRSLTRTKLAWAADGLTNKHARVMTRQICSTSTLLGFVLLASLAFSPKLFHW